MEEKEREHKYTAKLAELNPSYYAIYLNGRLHRVCPVSELHKRYPDIEIVKD